MQDQKILFEDKDVKITDKMVTIKCYFFPIGTAKRIPLNDIVKVEIRDLGMAKWRLWGMDAMAWGYWLPGDCSRPSREQFIAIYTGKSIVPSLTTQNTAIVYNILVSEVQKIRDQRMNGPISGVFIQQNRGNDQNSMNRPILHE